MASSLGRSDDWLALSTSVTDVGGVEPLDATLDVDDISSAEGAASKNVSPSIVDVLAVGNRYIRAPKAVQLATRMT